MSQADLPSATRALRRGEWIRARALRNHIPLRFLDRWAGGGAGKSGRVAIECDLFHGLPTKAMRAWIEQGART